MTFGPDNRGCCSGLLMPEPNESDVPSNPKRPCAHPGCPALVDSARCPQHTRAYSQQRGGSTERGYDYRWQLFRATYLAANSLCLDCQDAGHWTHATDVHHIRKLRDGGPRLDPANCRPLCHECHAMRTGRGE